MRSVLCLLCCVLDDLVVHAVSTVRDDKRLEQERSKTSFSGRREALATV